MSSTTPNTVPPPLTRQFDLQPHPRILAMLGEINLPQWRCAAELIDNAVDGFLRAARSGAPITNPQVHVNLPTADSPGAKVTVRDNGPGMAPEMLETAVKAGWSGNDAISNLGLFGMGLNIATAKLGRVTEVWTARPEDAEWCGVRVDFDELAKQGHFKTQALTRVKADPTEHGTEIVVTNLKPEQRQFFAKANNRAQIGRLLGEAYGAMLRTGGDPVEFTLHLNGPKIAPWQHCVWGSLGSDHREVILAPPIGTVDAVQIIDRNLPSRPFCQACWEWLPDGTSTCTACGSSDVIARDRRIHGWLGIQRYLHETDFGIDFIRNGRKIEIKSKELFDWVNPDGTIEKEYPIDDHRRLGRIVGEIHIDHCRVSYMKDRFERTDVAWGDMLRIVRGDGPLRPEIAKDKGYPPGTNTSPLFKLYQAFRRSSPYKKVPGCYAKLLLVPPELNDRAKQMGEAFRKGDSQFQTDSAWWAVVEQEDKSLLTQQTATKNTTPSTTPTSAPPPAAGPLPGFGTPSGAPGVGPVTPSKPAPPPRTANATLSQRYLEPITGQSYTVNAYEAQSIDPILIRGTATVGGTNQVTSFPWVLAADAASGVFDFIYDPRHSVFQSSTMTPLDALLAELAAAITDQQRSIRSASDIRFSTILASLRNDYGGPHKLDPAALITRAAAVLTAIAKKASANLQKDEGAGLFEDLSTAEREAIISRMVTRQVQNASGVIAAGQFLEYAASQTLLRTFERYPELFFDGRCWEDSYSTLELPSDAATTQAKQEKARYFAGLLMDAAWLAAGEPQTVNSAGRERVLRSALALELLAPDE